MAQVYFVEYLTLQAQIVDCHYAECLTHATCCHHASLPFSSSCAVGMERKGAALSEAEQARKDKRKVPYKDRRYGSKLDVATAQAIVEAVKRYDGAPRDFSKGRVKDVHLHMARFIEDDSSWSSFQEQWSGHTL